VSPFFDSMVAKVIAHGPTRVEACANLRHALADTLVLGVATNKYLLQTILDTDSFVSGEEVTTAFLARMFPSRETRVAAPDDVVWTLAAWLTTLARPARERVPEEWRDWSSALASLAPWRLRNDATGADVERKGVAELGRGEARVNEGDKARNIRGALAGPGTAFTIEIDGVRLDAVYAWQGDELWLQVARSVDGALRVEDHVFTDLRYAPSASADAKAADAVFSPLNGRVISVDVAPGASVKRNQKVAVMEAMKMEHTLTAPRDGTVRAVSVKVGDQLRSRHKMIELEPEA
jgi:acetyl/propionyl-CoA carboxylase alpha subunit